MIAPPRRGERDGRGLVLAVIDGLKPSMLERAVAAGNAPTLELLMQRGVYVDDCVAAFPSVTPTCVASLSTGTGPAEHEIPSMNWYHRGERRYVEYGSSFQASRAVGFHRSLTDTIYNLNLAHLSRRVRTVYEVLDDAGLRTAGTTFLIYRGRHRHQVGDEGPLARLVTSTLFRHGVWGPQELFYADLFASRDTGCRSQLGLPGARDQHAGCVGAYLVEHDLFDFLLLSLPDNDTLSHRSGPAAQVTSIASADRELDRLMQAAGGPDPFLERYALIVLGDHSHTRVERSVSLGEVFASWEVLPAGGGAGLDAEIAVCPAQRFAMVYVLDPERRERALRRLTRTARAIDGVDLALWRQGEEGVIASLEGELHFAPGGDVRDASGRPWHLDGELAVLGGELRDGELEAPAYPDALERAWSALTCRTSGDLLLSAGPGYEFVDWGGIDHVGGGSHGSLHRSDSLGALVMCGAGPQGRDERAQWTLRDVVPVVREHFGVE